MKNICVSMALTEKVLESYLTRVFGGQTIARRTCKTVFFPESNLMNKLSPEGWSLERFKSFCIHTPMKGEVRMYKAKITQREARR